jgi:hypothetical protein
MKDERWKMNDKGWIGVGGRVGVGMMADDRREG